MNGVNKLIASILFLASLGRVSAAENDESKHYIFNYETGDRYDVILKSNTITWTGISGSDVGMSETDSIKRKFLSKNVEVLQWKEKNGIFVTVVFDKRHFTIVSSGKTLNEDWLAYGIAEEK